VTIHVHVDVALYGHPLDTLGESARQAAQEALVVAGDTRVAHVVIEDLVTGPPALPGELS
jgi:predicted SpoU family rRNA methylase